MIITVTAIISEARSDGGGKRQGRRPSALGVKTRLGERMEVTGDPGAPFLGLFAYLLDQAHLFYTFFFFFSFFFPSFSAPDLPSWCMGASIYFSPVFLDMSLPALQSCSLE